MTLYLEQYFDGLQKLPQELTGNLRKLREMDESVTSNLQQADQLVRVYMKSTKSSQLTVKAKNEKYDSIKTLLADARQLSDSKVELASSTYELVDKYIRRLDADLIRFESDIKRRLLGAKAEAATTSHTDDNDDEKPKTFKMKTPKSHKKQKQVETPVTLIKSGKRKHQAVAEKQPPGKKRKTIASPPPAAVVTPPANAQKTPVFGSTLESFGLHQLSGVGLLQKLAGGDGAHNVDMPVDPNEPTYCTCHQVSYGEMVGCDNNDCPIEWFHFGCVGLTSKPKGKWYCPQCTHERQKQKKTV